MFMKKQAGFTIAEIAVVIVVIGVLVTFTVVGFRNAQLKARNSQTSAAVKVYRDALILYESINRSYPAGNADAYTCLGSDYPSDKCWFNDYDENTAFMTALKSVYGNRIPMPALNPLNLKGAFYSPANKTNPNTLDGTARDFIFYAIEGTAACPVGPVASDGGDGNVLTYSSTLPASGQTVPPSGNNPAQCVTVLPLAG